MPVECIKRILFRQPDYKESLSLSTAEKVRNLISLIHMDDIGLRVEEIGPYALVPFTDGHRRTTIFVVRDDNDTPEDRAQISALIDELKFKPEYEKLEFDGVEPRRFLAQLVTNGMYIGFHDKMGFAVMSFTGLLGIFGAPSSRKIDNVLRNAGFNNIGHDLD